MIKIFGAGVGGLTVAHILSNHPAIKYDIEVFELKSEAGGLARTVGPKCDTREISWRVYFHFYKNLLAILKQIQSTDGKSVYDHLVPYENVYLPYRTIPYSISQLAKIGKLLFASDERLDALDDTSWYDYTKQDSDAIPQWLGLDRYRGSVNSVIKIGVEQSVLSKNLIGESLLGYVLDGPTSDVWINPWVEQLKSKGVKFNFNTEITQVVKDKEKIDYVLSKDGTVIKGDWYVFGLPIEALSKLFPDPNYKKLANDSYQIQLAFQMHLSEHLTFGDRGKLKVLSVLPFKTPWGLIIEAKDISWGLTKNNLQKCPWAQWSITVCQANVPGNKIKKALVDCTFEEAQIEILHELENEESLINFLKERNPGFNGKFNVKLWSTMNDTYKLNGQGKFYTSEPKFTNNAGTKKLRPSVKLGKNALLSTGYAKETIDIFSMEAAAISGTIAANTIMDKESTNLIPRRPFILLEPFRKLDGVLFKCNLPDVMTIMILFSFIFLTIWLFRKV